MRSSSIMLSFIQCLSLCIFAAFIRVAHPFSPVHVRRGYQCSSSPSLFGVVDGGTSQGAYTYDRISETNRLPDYNGDELQAYYNKKPFVVWERLVDIGSPILGWYISRKWSNMTNTLFGRSPSEREALVNIHAEDLKDAIVQGQSITFIKSGQALSLRPDLVKSPEYVRELTKLQDEVGTFPTHIAMNIISKEFDGQDPHELYHFDPPDPIASASIGQVFRAITKDTNETVAVKVQRPDAISTAPIDMYILRNAARWLKRRKKLRSDLVAIADEFGCQIYKELNYIEEAENCVKFGTLYGDIPGIYIPSVRRDLTRRRVLTQEYIEGEKGPWAEGGEQLLTVGLQCSVLQLLGTGFFHSDPHRGNLLKMKSGELAYLDFGMMAEVPASRRYALIGTVLGLVNKDLNLVIDNLKSLDFLPEETDTQVVVEALSNAVLNSTTDGRSGSTLNFTELNKNINAMSYLLPISLPPFYTLIVRTLTILEGLALSVDPSFKLVKGAYPFIAKQILLNQGTNDVSARQEMSNLLQAIMIDRETKRIKWNKLEQFVSISSYADKALDGDFQALKSAQSRADLIKTYASGNADNNGEEDGMAVTLDLVLQMLDFLLSDNGDFIRDPLINEIVETIDALGLTGTTVLSLATNGLVPRPSEVPDQETVTQFLNLLSSVLAGRSVHTENSEERENSHYISDETSTTKATDSARKDNNNTRMLSSLLSTLANILSNRSALYLDSTEQKRISEIAVKCMPLIRQILARLTARNVRRFTQEVFSRRNIQAVLPNIVSMLDMASTSFNSRRVP